MTDPLRLVTGPIRPGAHPVHVYNDGLTGFMYDLSNEGAIRRKKPEVAFGVGRGTVEEKKTTALLRAGSLLVFGLPQDDTRGLEVVVGPPLSAEETAGARWVESVPGFLDL